MFNEIKTVFVAVCSIIYFYIQNNIVIKEFRLRWTALKHIKIDPPKPKYFTVLYKIKPQYVNPTL